MRYLLLVLVLALASCTADFSVDEVSVWGETMVEDYEFSFGEE